MAMTAPDEKVTSALRTPQLPGEYVHPPAGAGRTPDLVDDDRTSTALEVVYKRLMGLNERAFKQAERLAMMRDRLLGGNPKPAPESRESREDPENLIWRISNELDRLETFTEHHSILTSQLEAL